MGLDMFVFRRCSKCKTINQFELYRSDNFPFDIENEEHWKLLRSVMLKDILDMQKAWRSMTEEEQDIAIDEECTNTYFHRAYLRSHLEKVYIANNLKFIDEGAFNFCHCEHCGKPLMFYVISA